MPPNLSRTLASLASLLLAGSTVFANALQSSSTGTPEEAQHFLEEHCYRCHGEKKQKGELRMDTLARDFAQPLTAAHWADALERISAGEMPPEDEPQPKADEAARIAEWISAQLKDGESTRMAKRERVTFHKLTREEYANTIRDLLGVHFDAADPTGLPEDTIWQGFERIGSVLTIAPAHVEKYFAAAESILAEALPTEPPKPLAIHCGWKEIRGGSVEMAKELEIADKVRVEVWPGSSFAGGPPGPVDLKLPAAGDYRMRIKLSGLKPPKGRAPRVSVYSMDLDRLLFEQDVVAPEDQPVTLEIPFHMPAGAHLLRFTCEAPGPSNSPRYGRPDTKRLFTTVKDAAVGRHPWQIKLCGEDGAPLYPFLIVDSVDIEGPLQTTLPTAAQQQLFPPGNQDLAQAREILTHFTERAFRRPVANEEIDRLLKLVDAEMKSGEKFESAVKTALLAVLCSKDFLYLVEGSLDRADTHLTDWELASRLSYFLWSTMPDARLLELARTGTLHEPAVLRGEVARLLHDPQAARFTAAFPRQWLQLQRVGMFPPDKKKYPEYDAHLEKSMVAEASAFFREVLEKNLSVREFLDSDWAMLNARLAEHYGIPDVAGDGLQRVALKAEDHRGGLLTQAGVLSLTSDGQRQRPVHRGKWVLETIFNKSPPPPPANVKAIEPTPAGQPKATLRMKLEAHKSDANCAACHRKIDPLGLAFDNYDAIGRWRTAEKIKDGAGDDPPIDASGELPDGRKFTDGAELKHLLLADSDKFAAAFIEKLATFALRRAMTFDDRRALAALTSKSKAADDRLPAIIEELVASDLFQQR